MNIYPRCARSLLQFYNLNPKLINKFISKNINVNTFDVSLRDGLQGLSLIEQTNLTTDVKKRIYNYLINKYNPTNLEIGSCINKNILPIFDDTEELLRYSEEKKKKFNKEIDHYILVPNQEQLINALKFGARNFSFISSVSNSFQIKNTKMSLNDSLINLNNMMYYLDDYSNSKLYLENNIIYTPYKVKLYVSCINECPIEGKISINNIISYLCSLNKLKFDKICLSDTCGTLTHTDFIDIIENIINVGLDIKKFTLHLHIKQEREEEVEKIFHSALDYGITEFDVSDINTGGCSVTMDKDKLAPNMSYIQYYKFLINYMLYK